MKIEQVIPALLFAGVTTFSFSQEQVSAETQVNEADSNKNEAPVSGWRTSCVAIERSAPLTCFVEQSIFVPGTSQQLLNVKLQVADKKQLDLFITTPIGLFLPAGINIRVDQTEPKRLDLQTCDASGCYAAMTDPEALVGVMKTGKDLSVTFQNLAQEDINVSMPLHGFSEGLAKIN